MIDQRQRHYCLRGETLGQAAAISLGLFAILPAMALVCCAAGGVAAVACGLCWLVLAILAFGSLTIGIVATAIGLLGEAGEAIGVGIGLLAVGAFFYQAFERAGNGLVQAASDAWEGCLAAAQCLLCDVFIAYHVHLWTWSVLAAALVAAGCVGGLILLLRGATALRNWARRIHHACPHCFHRGHPACRCPHCAAWVHGLEPSSYGVFSAACGHCHGPLPTRDSDGRRDLDRACAGCEAPLDFPGIGDFAEYHVAVVGGAHSGKSQWVAKSLAASGIDPRSVPHPALKRPAPGSFNDPLVASYPAASGRGRLLYLYQPSGAEGEQEHGLAGRGFPAFVDRIVLVLDPLAEEAACRAIAHAGSSVRPRIPRMASTDAVSILGRLLESLASALCLTPTARIDLPITVLVAKTDILAALLPHAFAKGRGDPARNVLAGLGLDNFVRLVESRFSSVEYDLGFWPTECLPKRRAKPDCLRVFHPWHTATAN